MSFIESLFMTPLFVMAFFIITALLALIPANVAHKKGYSFLWFYLFGFFCFIPAIMVALLLIPKIIVDTFEIDAYKSLRSSRVISDTTCNQHVEEIIRKRILKIDGTRY